VLKSKLLLTTLTLLFICANELGSWPVLRLWNLYANRGFIDLQIPLRHIQCFSQGAEMEDLRRIEGTCGGYWYGSTFIYIGKLLQVTQDSKYFLVAAIFIPLIYFLVSLGQQAYLKQELVGRILVIASLFSPPLILLFQRGNLDGLIVLSLIISTKLMEGSQKKTFLGWFIILIATLIKFWCLPALFISLLWLKNLVLKCLALAVSILVTFVVIKEYQSVDFGATSLTNENIFGFRFLSLNLNSTVSYSFNPKISLILDFLAFALTFALSILLLRGLFIRNLLPGLHNSLQNHKGVWILGSSFLLCYFASSNVDYRLTPLLILALGVVSRIENLQISNLLLVLLASTMWLTFPSGQLQLLGDVLAGVFSCLLMIYFLTEIWNITTKRFRFNRFV
jgi:hypothetical protein